MTDIARALAIVGVSAAEQIPPEPPAPGRIEVTIDEIDRPEPWGGPHLRVIMRGRGTGGAYYWTPEEARAIFVALRAYNVLGDRA